MVIRFKDNRLIAISKDRLSSKLSDKEMQAILAEYDREKAKIDKEIQRIKEEQERKEKQRLEEEQERLERIKNDESKTSGKWWERNKK